MRAKSTPIRVARKRNTSKTRIAYYLDFHEYIENIELGITNWCRWHQRSGWSVIL